MPLWVVAWGRLTPHNESMTGQEGRAMDNDVQAYLDTITSRVRRRDAETVLELMGRVSGQSPKM